MIETVDSSQPFVFLFGAGGLLPEFESNLSGKDVGDSVDFGIEAANAMACPTTMPWNLYLKTSS